MLKIASWNVNSLSVRLPQVLAWSAAARPDVLALQETKLTDDRFPAAELREAGYHSLFSGQKTYNGVAVLSRDVGVDPVTDIPGLDDHQRRILAVTVGDVRIVNLYVVNGGEVGSEKFDYKLRWLRYVTDWLAGELLQHRNVVVLGDFNIAPDDRDVYDPAEWREKILCSTPERIAELRKMVPIAGTSINNPLDAWPIFYNMPGTTGTLSDAIKTLSRDKSIHSILLHFDEVRYLRQVFGEATENFLRELVKLMVQGCRYARDEMGKAIMVCVSLDAYSEDEVDRGYHLLAKKAFESEQFPVYPALGASIKALSNLYRYKARSCNL